LRGKRGVAQSRAIVRASTEEKHTILSMRKSGREERGADALLVQKKTALKGYKGRRGGGSDEIAGRRGNIAKLRVVVVGGGAAARITGRRGANVKLHLMLLPEGGERT